MRISDWSSDVCSSDLLVLGARREARREQHPRRVEVGQRREHVLELTQRHALQPEALGHQRAQQRLVRVGLDREIAAVDRLDVEQRARAFAQRRQVVDVGRRPEEHTSELQSLMRISYAVFCLKKKKQTITHTYKQCYYYKKKN